MRYVLCGINAKYIHTNLAVLSLQAYCREKCGQDEAENRAPDHELPQPEILVKEYTINNYVEDILQDLYLTRADVFVFSSYIWNIDHVKELAAELKKVSPACSIWAGGPEVSYDGPGFLRDNPAFDLIMQGEGEEVFRQLTRSYDGTMDSVPPLPGIALRRCGKGQETGPERPCMIEDHGFAPLMDMDRIPFVYQDFSGFAHKILYYETSRGCPFRCSYCLSSVDKRVRYRDLAKVKKELDAFLKAGVAQVKFVDRTFNCDISRAKEIWRYLSGHDNGVTNFHFEISADLLDDECLEIFREMRPGLIQLEIGVQSTNPPTIDAIRRHMDLDELFRRVDQVHDLGNIHQHLDLIAGLPYEGIGEFARSFDEVYVHEPDQLQLGFLKVLKGTRMMEEAEGYGISYRDRSPYEVLSTGWITYDDLILLKGVEEMVETYYNSGQYTHTLRYVLPLFESPFLFYRTFSAYYRGRGLHLMNHNRPEKYEILRAFLRDREKDLPLLDELLLYDFCLRERIKKRPGWAPDLMPDRKKLKEIRRVPNHCHMEGFSFDICAYVRDGSYLPGKYICLFDYSVRNPLNHEAGTECFLMEEED